MTDVVFARINVKSRGVVCGRIDQYLAPGLSCGLAGPVSRSAVRETAVQNTTANNAIQTAFIE